MLSNNKYTYYALPGYWKKFLQNYVNLYGDLESLSKKISPAVEMTDHFYIGSEIFHPDGNT